MPGDKDVAADGMIEVLEEDVPVEFFNVKFWLIVYLLLTFVLGLERIVHPMLDKGPVPQAAWVVLGVWVGHEILVFACLQLWTKARLSGFYLVALIAHVAFVGNSAALVYAIAKRNTPLIVVAAVVLGFIFICLLINLWSRELVGFFRRLNGKCPLCRAATLRDPKKNRRWTCPSCRKTVLWRLSGDKVED
jgi:hypothetical protein